MPEAGKITEEETVTLPLSLYVKIPQDLIGWIVRLPHVARLGLTVISAVPPSGRDSPLVLHPCNPYVT